MNNLRDFSRIAVVGCAGSGKSTLARQIAAQTGHPLIHLDYHYWQPGWVPAPRDEFIAKMERWVQGERWIIDGNYKGTMELRFAAADLAIYLDPPPLLCVWRAVRRHGKPRPDMRPDVIESSVFTKEFIKFCGHIRRFRKDSTPQILALHEKHPEVQFLHLRSRKAVRELIE